MSRTGDLATDLAQGAAAIGNRVMNPGILTNDIVGAVGSGAKGDSVEGMDLREFLKATGWPDSQIENAAAIVSRESGGVANKCNDGLNQDGSVDCGLFQVNLNAHHQDRDDMKDPVKNSKYALGLFKSRQWRDWFCNETLTACTHGVAVPTPAPKGMKISGAGNAKVSGGIGGIIDSVTDPIDSVGDGLEVIAGGVATLFKAETWFRVMKVVGGSLVFLFGLIALLKVANVSVPIPAVKGAKAIAKAV